jgi:transcriptional regulator with XRE-family HTH domain
MAPDLRVRFGSRLRHGREASRMSLGDVADRAGVTKSFLSRVERDETSPSVASLVAICDALALPMADLFSVPETTLVRRSDRAALADLPKAADVVDTLESQVAPGASGGTDLYTMPSEAEVCFVLEGAVEVRIDDDVYALKEGDALTFGAAAPHTWRNRSQKRAARILWILAPGIPDPQGEVR